MIRLVAFDLDGTLMGSDQTISSRVRRAIAAAQARGVTITIATGRMFSALLPFARELAITAPALAYQGGWIQLPDADTPLYRVSLAHDIARQTLELATEHDWHAVLYADGAVYLQTLRYPPTFYEALMGLGYRVVDAWQPVLNAHTPDKVLFVAQPDEIPAIGAALRAHLGDQAQVFRSNAKFIEVVPLGVDKGVGLAWLAHYLGLAQDEVMAVGDQENDAPMVAWAGIGVAMGDADPALRALADWTAPSLAHDGAAVALEHWVLGER